MEVISGSLDILINLTKYQKAREVVSSEEVIRGQGQLVSTIISLLNTYREKESMNMYKLKSDNIFTKGCAILWALSHVESVKLVSKG